MDSFIDSSKKLYSLCGSEQFEVTMTFQTCLKLMFYLGVYSGRVMQRWTNLAIESNGLDG